MNKIIKVYSKGFEQGMIDAMHDINKNNIKEFKNIDVHDIKSKIYDIGYIQGYKKFVYKEKNNLLIN